MVTANTVNFDFAYEILRAESMLISWVLHTSHPQTAPFDSLNDDELIAVASYFHDKCDESGRLLLLERVIRGAFCVGPKKVKSCAIVACCAGTRTSAFGLLSLVLRSSMTISG